MSGKYNDDWFLNPWQREDIESSMVDEDQESKSLELYRKRRTQELREDEQVLQMQQRWRNDERAEQMEQARRERELEEEAIREKEREEEARREWERRTEFINDLESLHPFLIAPPFALGSNYENKILLSMPSNDESRVEQLIPSNVFLGVMQYTTPSEWKHLMRVSRSMRHTTFLQGVGMEMKNIEFPILLKYANDICWKIPYYWKVLKRVKLDHGNFRPMADQIMEHKYSVLMLIIHLCIDNNVFAENILNGFKSLVSPVKDWADNARSKAISEGYVPNPETKFGLTHLDISGFNYKIADIMFGDLFRNMFIILGKNKTLKELVMNDTSGKNIAVDLDNVISEMFSNNSTLEVFSAANSCIIKGGINGIVNGLQQNLFSQLRKLNLSSNDMSLVTTEIADLVLINRSLTILKLDGCELSKDAIVKVGEALMRNNTLVHISLEANYGGDEGAGAIAGSIRINKFSKLKILKLRNNEITGVGVNGLAGALKENKVLKHLDLSKNSISEALRDLGESLKVNNTLEVLELEDCNILPIHILEFTETFAKNKTLMELNLSDNEFLSQYSNAVLTKLFESTLISLNLSECSFDALHIDCDLLGNLIADNIFLEELDLSYNELDKRQVRKILGRFSKNKTLVQLNLSGNDLSDNYVWEIKNRYGDRLVIDSE